MTRNRVILLPSPNMTTSASWSMLRRKRRTLWQHTARNQLIASVGMSCLAQDKQALKSMGIPVKKTKKNGVWIHRVAILTENSEHAHVLKGLLPKWDLLDTVPALEPEDEPKKVGTPATLGRIITWMHAQRHDFEVDYLIRATGWRGHIGLTGSESWLAQPKRRVVIVDLDDAWDVQAIMDTEARVREYREQYLEVICNKEPANSRRKP